MPAVRRHCSWNLPLVLLVAGFHQAGAIQVAAAEEQPVTGKIMLGPHEGVANPSHTGHAKTGGGSIEVSQPAPDTLVVRMSGNAAAIGSSFISGSATFDFFEDLQFSVDFSQPGHVGQLILQTKMNGLLVSHGKQAGAGLPCAMATVFAGPQQIASLPMPERMVYGSESTAVHLSQGPVCVPIQAGCYGLRQQLRITAYLAKGCCLGGRATAEFSPSALPTLWQGTSYPFSEVDKQELGYTVTIRVVPTAGGPSLGQFGHHRRPRLHSCSPRVEKPAIIQTPRSFKMGSIASAHNR